MDAGNAFDDRNGVSFEQKRENHLGFLHRQLHAVEGIVTGIRKHLAALRALEALAIFAFTELPALDTAGMTGHGIS